MADAWAREATGEEEWEEGTGRQGREAYRERWARWSSQAERSLIQAGILEDNPGARARGTEPKLVPGGSGSRPGTSVAERRERKRIRTCWEAWEQQARSGTVYPGLVRAVRKR